MHTENQLPRLPGSALKVPGGGWGGVGSYPLSSQVPTHVEVELGCDNNEEAVGILEEKEKNYVEAIKSLVE